MENLLQDIRYSFRMLIRNPGITAVSILVLALGIGATTAIYTPIDALQLHPLPFENLDRMAVINEVQKPQNRMRNDVSPADFVQWKENASQFELIASYRYNNFNLTNQAIPERISGCNVSPNFFKVFGMAVEQGRTFYDEEDQQGRNRVAIIGHALWQNRFAGQPVIDTTITLDGSPYTIVGIMPRDFSFPMTADIWTPLTLTPQELTDHSQHTILTVARLKPNIGVNQAQSEMDSISGKLEAEFPQTNTGRATRVVLLRDHLVGTQSGPFTALTLGAALFVLLLACSNVISIQLARAIGRQKEMAVRLSIGASRWRILQQFLTESLVQSLVAGVLGATLAVVIIKIIKSIMPDDIARQVAGWRQMSVNPRVLLFCLIVAIGSSIIIGIIPGLRAGKVNLSETLKEGGRGTTSSLGRRIRSLLVTVEVILAIVLLIGAGLMVKGTFRLLDVYQGFEPNNVLTMRLMLPQAKYANATQSVVFYDQLLQRLQNQPGVESVGAVFYLPISVGGVGQSRITIEGQTLAPGQQQSTEVQSASADYFKTIRIPMLDGRTFAETDNGQAPSVAIVSKFMARQFWQNENPIGKRLKMGGIESTNPWITIIGVVGDVKPYWFDREPRSILYLPYSQSPKTSMFVLARTNGDPNSFAATARAEVLSIDKDQPVYDVRSLDTALTDSVSDVRIVTTLMLIFGLMALVLAAVGIFSILHYSITQRTHEIGIRMALGAQRSNVQRQIVTEAYKMTLVGLVVGIPLAFLLSSSLARALAGLIRLDNSIFLLASLMILVVTFISSYLPARRASALDPMIALRGE